MISLIQRSYIVPKTRLWSPLTILRATPRTIIFPQNQFITQDLVSHEAQPHNSSSLYTTTPSKASPLSFSNHITISHFRSHIGKTSEKNQSQSLSTSPCQSVMIERDVPIASAKISSLWALQGRKSELLLIKSFKQPSKYVSNHKRWQTTTSLSS